jgi:hypothetical protein
MYLCFSYNGNKFPARLAGELGTDYTQGLVYKKMARVEAVIQPPPQGKPVAA